MKQRMGQCLVVGLGLSLLSSPYAEGRKRNLRRRQESTQTSASRMLDNLEELLDANDDVISSAAAEVAEEFLAELAGTELEQSPRNTDEEESEVKFGAVQKSTGKATRIVGGTTATKNEDPYFTLLLKQKTDGSFVNGGCGGSLISNCHILTAAHCVEATRKIDAVYVGAYQPFNGNPGVDYHFTTISEIISHPDYIPQTNQNDVALLKMDECLDTERFPPIELARNDRQLSRGQMFEVLGFGKLGESDSTAVKTLRKVEVPFISLPDCKRKYNSTPYSVFDDMICAGFEQGGKDACKKDSGGPLVLPATNTTKRTQYGVVSWGYGCARANTPGVYASVPFHYDWIASKVCVDTDSDFDSFGCETNDDDDFVSGSALAPGLWDFLNDSINSHSNPPTQPATSAPTPFCVNSSGSFTVGGQKFKCDHMAPGERGHDYCWSYDARIGQLGIDYCRASCHPQCLN